MLFDRDTVNGLEQCTPCSWEGIVYRHMFAGFLPERENVRGARWNPPEVPAIYTSLTRDAAISEADYYISLQSIRPSVRRTIYEIEVKLDSVLDLAPDGKLKEFGLTSDDLASIDHAKCWMVGGAAEWLENDGILVPSARSNGTNLVIYPNRKKPNYRFEVISSEELDNS